MVIRLLIGITIGTLIGALFSSCASAPKFDYKYYALHLHEYEGTLRGPEPAFDLSMAICRPGETDQAPCIVMITKDFLEMKSKFKSLEACK